MAADSADDPAPTQQRALIDQLGGVRGMIDGAIPALVFVTINVVAGLEPGLVGALAAGVVMLAVRLLRKEPVKQVLMGFVGLALAAFIAAKTGQARGFFLPGIVQNFAYATFLVGSVAVRRPLVGVVIASLEHGTPSAVGVGSAWRQDDRVRRIYARATLGWGAYFVVRGAVSLALYLADSPVGLIVVRLTGLPLILLGAVLTVAYTRRTSEPAAAS